MTVNRLFGVVVLGALLLAVGCAADPSAETSPAQQGPAPASPSATVTGAPDPFAECMRKHGVPNFPDPDGSGGYRIHRLLGIDPASPEYLGAYEACQGVV
jgi:hypothetical protein